MTANEIKAAEQGDARAQFNLGNRYLKGKEVEQDYAKAAEWFRKAAEQGYVDNDFDRTSAQEMLDELTYHLKTPEEQAEYKKRYYDAKYLLDTEKYDEAVPLLEQFAREGYADAQYVLYQCYSSRYHGVKQDMDKAYRWRRRAERQGHEEALSVGRNEDIRNKICP